MKRQKVLFIEKLLTKEKLGIMYLAAGLNAAGIETLLIEYEKEDIFRVMHEFAPDFVCYSVITGEHKTLLQLNRKLKRLFHFQSIWGGPHATFFSSQLFSNAGVDVVVQGEGVETLVDLVRTPRGKGIVRGAIISDLDQYPFPRRELLYRNPVLADNKTKTFITMLNCPFNCAYCYNHSYNSMFGINRKNLRRRSVKNVIAEIQEVRDMFGLERVLFIDDNFLLFPEWILNFCKIYRHEINLPFMCSFRADLLTDRLLNYLLEAGLSTVNFAIETSNEQLNRDLLSRRLSLSRVVHVIKILKGSGVKVRMQNMIGLPISDSLTVALETLKFNLEYPPDFSWVSIYQPYPKTRLGEYCIDHGYCNQSVVDKLEDNFFTKSKLNLKHKKRIERLACWWTWIVSKRVPIFFVKLLILFPIPLTLRNKLLHWKINKAHREIYQDV